MATDPRILVLAEMRKQTALLERIAAALGGGATSTAPAAASDRDLDGPHGDPIVRAKDPQDWTGEPMKGRKFSECPPDYLDMLAARFDYFAGREEDAKKAGYNRKDATRARGWAARLRGGWKPDAPASMAPVTDENGDFVTDDGIRW